ncbi:GAF domain-containing protein [Streptomyces sp. SA15]|uniref:GAF domain-containing protein n=1 Tax=Streptomyces sp. SA15 TaxID=934019 RepID=UPI00117EA1F7|nr:GAF domain-containing protein [Streptomyces sp. SA15]
MTGNSSTVPEAPGPTPDVEPGEQTRRSAGGGASEVVLLLDPQGHVLSVGTGATLPGGHGPADLVGRHVSVLYPSENAASGGAARALDAAAGLGTHRECAWRVRPDGVRFWAETVITATRDAHARLAGYCVAVHDLTARWRHESRQRAVAEVTQSVMECRPGPEALALAARRVRESVGAETARVLAVDWGDTLTVCAADGVADKASRGLLMPGESALVREVVRLGRPRIFSDTDHEPAKLRTALRDAGLASVMDVPLTVRERIVGLLEVTNRRGGRCFTSEDLRFVEPFSGPVGLAVERSRAEEDLDRLGRTSLVGQNAVQQALNSVAAEAVTGTGAVCCVIYLLEPEAGLRLAGCHGSVGPLPCDRAERPVAQPVRVAMEAITRAAPVISGIRGDGEDADTAVERDPESAREPAPDSGEVLTAVPLLCRQEAVGALCCRFPRGHKPGAEDLGAFQTLAGRAATTVEAQRLRAVAREQTARDERRHLARELHDSLCPALYGIALNARVARELLGREHTEDTGAHRPIDSVLRLTDAALSEIRTILCRLSPESLETEGLATALSRYVGQVRVRHAIAVEASLSAEPDVAPKAKHALYRIAQEALHNVIKHAAARHVLLSLSTEADTVTLVITDDGVGFDTSRPFPGHLGLRSMRERAREAGGALDVDSRPGRGTRVRAAVPARVTPDGSRAERPPTQR